MTRANFWNSLLAPKIDEKDRTVSNSEPWQIWGRVETESTLELRARGELPEMEATKQLVELVSEVYEPGMGVLDVGCNTGHYLIGLRRLDPDITYVGVDAYPHYIEKAREIHAGNPNASFGTCDVMQPIPAELRSDIVICCNVLVHLPDYRAALANLIETTGKYCFVRTSLGERTTITKRALSESFDENGEPLDYKYLNTYDTAGFISFIDDLGCKAEVIEDKFDASVLNSEIGELKGGRGTRAVDGMQVDGNIVYLWKWVKISKPGV
jgi:SAM-dependent methyltransferase